MKTLYDRAKKYAEKHSSETTDMRQGMHQAYVKGVQDEYNRLTKWYDPEKKQPRTLKKVLIKYIRERDTKHIFYTVGCRLRANEWLGEKSPVNDCGYKMLGWREIHE